MNLEQELKDTLTRRAYDVEPSADPLTRLADRQRRVNRRRVVTGVAVAIAVTAVMVPIGLRQVARADQAATGTRDQIVTTTSESLLKSPTRGSLASDTGYVKALAAAAAEKGAPPLPPPADAVRGKPLETRVLFVGDERSRRRVAVIAYRYPAGWFHATFTGPSGAEPAALVGEARSHSSPLTGGVVYLLDIFGIVVVAPVGHRIELGVRDWSGGALSWRTVGADGAAMASAADSGGNAPRRWRSA